MNIPFCLKLAFLAAAMAALYAVALIPAYHLARDMKQARTDHIAKINAITEHQSPASGQQEKREH